MEHQPPEHKSAQPPSAGAAAPTPPAGTPTRPEVADDSAIDLGRDPTAGAPLSLDDPWSAVCATRVIGDSPSGDTAPVLDGGAPPSESRPAAAGNKHGSTLGDFVLLKKLGEGAMGTVYKARQTSFNRTVALKVLFKHTANNSKLVERFNREARVAGRLDHPNVVRGYEVGEEAGWHYFAMEYVSGRSLQNLLTRLGKVSVGDALYIVLRAARGLQYIHEQGLVHRDVKPDNLLLTRDGEVKLADLGMVKLLDEELSLTQTGHAVGTPWYMPMEQAKNSKDIDGRCDIYALGCVLYCCLTGKPPFHGPTLVDVIQAKAAGTFPPARQFNPEVPERLDLIIAKMTAKHAKHRYQDCTQLLRDLEGLGLANEALAFLAPAAREAKADPAAAVGPTTVQTPLPDPLPPSPVDLWYVRYKTGRSQVVTRKLTTAEVLELITVEDFDPSARASRTPGEGFRALATYREFEAAALGRAAKTGADRQAFRYRKLYKQIEEEDRQRAAERAAERPVTPGEYWLGIGIRVGVGLVAFGLVYLLLRGLMSL
jgi:serine/threonine-protein kinase